MLYFRSRSAGRDLSRAAARAITLAALVLYPLGALAIRFGDNRLSSAAGYLLIAGSIACVATMMGSSLQRIVGEQVNRLDEYELKLRSRAVGAAYSCLGVLVLLALIYSAIAADRGIWMPRTYGEFNGLFWGAFLYASMLPSAFLAWQIDASDAQADSSAQ